MHRAARAPRFGPNTSDGISAAKTAFPCLRFHDFFNCLFIQHMNLNRARDQSVTIRPSWDDLAVARNTGVSRCGGQHCRVSTQPTCALAFLVGDRGCGLGSHRSGAMCRKCGSPPLLGPASKARCSRAIYATEKRRHGTSTTRPSTAPPNTHFR